jgi:hypothetical protein
MPIPEGIRYEYPEKGVWKSNKSRTKEGKKEADPVLCRPIANEPPHGRIVDGTIETGFQCVDQPLWQSFVLNRLSHLPAPMFKLNHDSFIFAFTSDDYGK